MLLPVYALLPGLAAICSILVSKLSNDIAARQCLCVTSCCLHQLTSDPSPLMLLLTLTNQAAVLSLRFPLSVGCISLPDTLHLVGQVQTKLGSLSTVVISNH